MEALMFLIVGIALLAVLIGCAASHKPTEEENPDGDQV
jgi:hypothetical protein